MKVVDLWNAFNDWTPFTSANVTERKRNEIHAFSYSEEVLNQYANSIVVSFDYDSVDDVINIEVY